MPEDPSGEWASREAPALVVRARADALEEARRRLTAELTEALLEAARPVAAQPHARRTAPARSPSPTPTHEGDGLWVYGIVDAGMSAPPSLTGVDGDHRVQLLRHGNLAALVSAVPLDEFGTDALERGLEDLTRLETLARAHERVLDAALALGAVLPFRLCTIYESREHLREMLEREGPELAARLNRLAGMAEWGVKGFVTSSRQSGQPEAAPASGTDYLFRKRDARDAVETAHAHIDEVAAQIHEELSAHAAGAVVSRPHDRRLSGHEGDMVLNASYLVAESRVEEFCSLVDALSRRHEEAGVELECVGPWPAYHFVDDG